MYAEDVVQVAYKSAWCSLGHTTYVSRDKVFDDPHHDRCPHCGIHKLVIQNARHLRIQQEREWRCLARIHQDTTSRRNPETADKSCRLAYLRWVLDDVISRLPLDETEYLNSWLHGSQRLPLPPQLLSRLRHLMLGRDAAEVVEVIDLGCRTPRSESNPLWRMIFPDPCFRLFLSVMIGDFPSREEIAASVRQILICRQRGIVHSLLPLPKDWLNGDSLEKNVVAALEGTLFSDFEYVRKETKEAHHDY